MAQIENTPDGYIVGVYLRVETDMANGTGYAISATVKATQLNLGNMICRRFPTNKLTFSLRRSTLAKSI